MTHEEFLNVFPQAIHNYQPSPTTIAQISKVKLLLVVGPFGVGKTTLMESLGLPYVPSDVTRPPRPGEKDGKDYFFRNDFERILTEIAEGSFVQVAISPDGEFYSTRATSYPVEGWASISIIAEVVPIFRNLGFAQSITAFITPPTYDDWMSRLATHQMDATYLNNRLAEARRSFGFALNDQNTHFILNDLVDPAVAQLKALMDNQIDKDRESSGYQAAQQIFATINKRA